MKSVRSIRYLFIGIILCLYVFKVDGLFGWGFLAHKIINAKAVDTLPAEIRSFYETHRTWLSEHSVDPDLWRRENPDEGYNHYINIDKYDTYPFDKIPHQYDEVIRIYNKDTVLHRGTAPWRIEEIMVRLTQAFTIQNIDSILIWSSTVGHYIGDLHMPLHTTINYDGQFTGNKGIHSRFERWMIEHYHRRFSFSPKEASYIKNTLKRTFQIIKDSYSFVDSIFIADVQSKKGLVGDDLYKIEENNGRKHHIYSDEYYHRLHDQLGTMANRLMEDAMVAIGSYWLTAWINAGKPDMPSK